MFSNGTENIAEISVDKTNLYREETFTDLAAGTIKRLSPVTIEGTPDATRSAIFIGQATMMAPTGPLPVQFELHGATTLEQALDQFPAAVKQAVDNLIEEAQKMRREAASRIVSPNQDQISKIIT